MSCAYPHVDKCVAYVRYIRSLDISEFTETIRRPYDYDNKIVIRFILPRGIFRSRHSYYKSILQYPFIPQVHYHHICAHNTPNDYEGACSPKPVNGMLYSRPQIHSEYRTDHRSNSNRKCKNCKEQFKSVDFVTTRGQTNTY